MGKGMERDGRWCRTAKEISAGAGHSSSISGKKSSRHVETAIPASGQKALLTGQKLLGRGTEAYRAFFLSKMLFSVLRA